MTHITCSIAPNKVLAQGADGGNLADTLSRMLGVYVGLKGEIMPENVKKWNVLKVCNLFFVPR